MALEISEIAIRMRVNDRDEQPAAAPAAPDPGTCGDGDRSEIVEDCVRRVLAALKNAQER